MPIIEPGVEFITSILVFNASSGQRVESRDLLDQIKSRKNNYVDYEWLSGKKPDQKIVDLLTEEYRNIVPVISGDDWTDYRPARPEDFVGRIPLINDIYTFFKNIIEGNSDTRLFSIKSPSGWGKSSTVLKIVSMAKSRRRSKTYFIYAVDVRTAISTRYVEMALKSCINSADESGFTNCQKRDIDISNITQFFNNNSIKETFAYLKKEKKLIILIFDQFEELFSKKELYGLFDSIRNLSNIVDSQKENFVIGFAWKTDLSIPAEHPAYYMWSNLADRRREFDLTQFNKSEIKSAISVFGKQLGEKINPVLASYLEKQCQGYPWLLKKLCIHVFNLIKDGANQETVIGKRLNIVELFDKDLSELTAEENSCTQAIAKETPADYFSIADIYGNEIVQSLINRRIVLRKASKLILYWDIFRDYVINKTIPIIILDYIPQYLFGALSKLLIALIDNNGSLDIVNLSKTIKFTVGTIDNLMIDAVMFGVAKRENGLISVTTNNESELLDILQDFFKRHIVFINIQTTFKEGFDYISYYNLFNKIYVRDDITEKTKSLYCAKLYNWFISLGLLYEQNNKYYFTLQKDNSISLRHAESKSRKRQKYFRHKEDNLFWGQASPEKVIRAYKLIESGVNSFKKLKSDGFRNCIEILSVAKGITKTGGNITLQKSLDEIMNFIINSDTIIFVLEELKKDPNIKIVELGEKLNAHYMRNWAPTSRRRYAQALLFWTKYIQNEYIKESK